MRSIACAALLAVAIVCRAGAARASSNAPLRVAIECEGDARTKACPSFLLGFVEANRLFLSSPRSDAEVVIHASATEVAELDHLHLRFVGEVAGAPPVVETDVDVDTRATDDAQRAQLEPAFLRGVALYVAARDPAAVGVTLATDDRDTGATPVTSPWGVKLALGGYGSWADQYQSFSGYTDLSLSRLARGARVGVSLHDSGGINRQPPLALADGTAISLDSRQWSVGAAVNGAWLASDAWSVGGAVNVWRDDPEGQYRYGANALAGVEWDRFPADDPRGNRLAVLYVAGYRAEGYNVPDVLGERDARYPVHALIASGSLRKDKVEIGLSLSLRAELLDPMRRHDVSASPFIAWQLGGHVDLGLSFSLTERRLPAPDRAAIDPTDYARRSRLSYAEPLAMNGSVNLTFHWDRTNGARNDRFSDL